MGTTTGTIPTKIQSPSKTLAKRTMQLFGLPYQFLPEVDQRDPGLSKTVGRSYMENIMMDASVVTIIPGEPKYLPGKDSTEKSSYTNALLDAAGGNFAGLAQKLTDDEGKDIRLYGFQPAYYKTFGYINALCRTTAAFLNLKDDTGYKINGKKVNFLNYDWKNYRWDGSNYSGTVTAVAKSTGETIVDKVVKLGTALKNATINAINGKGFSLKSGLKFEDDAALVEDYQDDNGDNTSVAEKMDNILANKSFIQFYTSIDSTNGQDDLSNSAQASSFSSVLDAGSSTMRDLAFLNQSGGIFEGDGIGDNLQKLGEAALSALGIVGNGVSASNSLGSRLKEAGSSVLMGENFAMPEIWGGTSNNKSYSLEFKFKAPYGNTLCFYTDVLVPVCFCIALAYPRSTGANTYKSPPLVKMYRQGVCVCNLGLVTSISINRDDVKESMNVDGQITEVSVNMTIQDLYSDISINTATDALGFYKNTSLSEYLGTMCGLDLSQPNVAKKGRAFMNNVDNWGWSKFASVGGKISELLDSKVASWTML